MSKDQPRVLLWDIESTNLVADYGRILCIAYKWLGEKKTYTIRIRLTKEFKRDRTDDSGVLKAFAKVFAKVFAKADLHVFWFGEYFDLPFFQTRLLMNGLEPLPPIPFIDGWKIARKKLKLRSNRLEAVGKIIPIKGRKIEKEHPRPIDWVRANSGYTDALKVIESRCVSDVGLLEQTYLALRPYGASLPNLSKLRHPEIEGCPACSSKRIQLRGTFPTQRGLKRRAQCQDCAHWFSVPVKTKV